MAADDPDREVVGAYFPTAFAIELRAPCVVRTDDHGLLAFDRRTFPVFMHEVAHLVQDRSTFRGVMDFIDVWDQIEVASRYIRGLENAVLLPINDPQSFQSRLPPDCAWATELGSLRQYREPRRPWSRDRFWAYEEDYVVERQMVQLMGRQIEHPFVTVHLVDHLTNEDYTHSLGAWEIKEAYSVAVGLLHGGEEKQPADWFQYLVIERILARHFGEVSPEQMIAISHWALQDLAPANTLFTLIEKFEQEFDALPPPIEIYDIARQEAIARGFQKNCEEILGMVQEIDRNMADQEPNLKNMLGWFRTHAERLLRLQYAPGRRFPLDTFLCTRSTQMNDADYRVAQQRFFDEVEVPLTILPNGEFHSIRGTPESTNAVFLNRCAIDLFHRIWAGTEPEWQCPVYEGCQLPLKDADCRRRPWTKNAVDPTCPYGAAAKILGLTVGKVPTFKPFDPPAPSQ